MTAPQHRRGARRALTRLAPAVLVAALATACGSGDGSTAAAAPQSISIAIELPVKNMDGLVSNSASVNQMIGAALTRVAVDGSVEGDLAAEWSSNPDTTQWTYTLKPDLKFSDGSPLTADDVVFSWQTVMADTASQQNTYVTPVATVSAPSPDTVVFDLTAPNATFARISTNIPIAPKASYDPATFNSMPIGAGAYKVVSFNGTDTMEVTANEHYHGDQPALKDATIQSVPDETTRLNGLQSGQYDAAMLSGNNITVAESAGLQVADVTGSKVIYLGYDSGEGPMANEKLRQAITYAVDRQALVDTILQGYGEPTSQMLSSSTFGYDPDAEIPEQDIAKAKELVAESGYTGEEIPLQYPLGYIPSPDDLSQAVASYLTDIGINVTLTPVDAGAFLTDWLGKTTGPLWLFSAQTSTLEGAGTFKFVDVVLHTADDPGPPAAYDAMVAEGDETERAELMAEENAYRTEKAYYTPLFVQDFVYVYGKDYALDPPANGFPNPALFSPAQP